MFATPVLRAPEFAMPVVCRPEFAMPTVPAPEFIEADVEAAGVGVIDARLNVTVVPIASRNIARVKEA